MAAAKKKSTKSPAKKSSTGRATRQPRDWKDVLPVNVGVRMPIRDAASSVLRVLFDVDANLLEKGDFGWWGGTAIVTYDFEHGAVAAVDAPFEAFCEHLIAYYDGGDMGAVKSVKGAVLWGHDSNEEADPEDKAVAAKMDEHLGNGAFADLCRRIVHALTAAAAR